MTLRSLSRLSSTERDAAARLLDANPVLSLYWTTAIEDLARGIDNRLVHFSEASDGIVFGAVFGDLTVFSFCGALADTDIVLCIAVPGAVELHVPVSDAARYGMLAAARVTRSRGMVLMTARTKMLDQIPVGCRDLQRTQVRDVAAFYRDHYPETVFDDYMLAMPFVGAFAAGQLIACAGTIAMAQSSGAALIGHFATAPDFRGQGHAGRLGQMLLDRLARRGFGSACLATTIDNSGAIRVYEKLGFVPIETLVQIDLVS